MAVTIVTVKLPTSSQRAERRRTPSHPLSILRLDFASAGERHEKKLRYRAMYLEDALHALAEMERTFAELESSDVFQAFTLPEKARYRDVLSRLRDLIPDLEQDTAQEQLALLKRNGARWRFNL